jgi:Fungal specific transcription factor domain
LNGLLIRAAQSIGLHRDGEHFNLSPLDCEIRRRLWWQILGSDARVTEDHGFLIVGFDSFCDTKLPLNIDDKDLRADMEAAPVSKPRWTDTTMFLVAAEMNRAIQQVSRLSAGTLTGDEKMTRLEQLLESVKRNMTQKYLQYCDPNIPIQKAALLLGRVLMGKLEVFVLQQYLKGLSAEEAATHATEQTLSLACDTIDVGVELKTDELLSNFQWLFSTYPQYHLLTYTLWHLCVRPDVSGADRAWDVVNRSFALTESPSWPDPSSKWNVLRNLRDKAFGIRRSFDTAKNSAVDDVISSATGQQVDISGENIFNVVFRDGMIWDPNLDVFLDWEAYH